MPAVDPTAAWLWVTYKGSLAIAPVQTAHREVSTGLFAAVIFRHGDRVIALYAVAEIQVLQALFHQEGLDLAVLAILVIRGHPQQIHRTPSGFVPGRRGKGRQGGVAGAFRGAYRTIRRIGRAGADQLFLLFLAILAHRGSAVLHLAVVGGGVAVSDLLAMDIKADRHLDRRMLLGQRRLGKHLAEPLVLQRIDHIAQVITGIQRILVIPRRGRHQHQRLPIKLIVRIRRAIERDVELGGAAGEQKGKQE